MDDSKLDDLVQRIELAANRRKEAHDSWWAHAYKVLRVSEAGLIKRPFRKHWWDLIWGVRYCPTCGQKLRLQGYGVIAGPGLSFYSCKVCSYEWAEDTGVK